MPVLRGCCRIEQTMQMHNEIAHLRIIDGLLRSAGGDPQPTLESNSMIVLFAHVRTGRWASGMPARLAESLGLTETIRAIPIEEILRRRAHA